MAAPSLPSTLLLQRQAQWLAPARGRLLRRADIARCRCVLDLGCGTGAVTGELVRRAAGPVVAVDRSREALNQLVDSLAGWLGQSGAVAQGCECNEGDSPVFRSTRVISATSLGRKTGQSPFVVQADAARLPFSAGSFDLVFCQFTLLWVDAAATIAEIGRVLAPGGRLVAIEPDYAAMIEHPAEIATRELWLAGLARAGAEPAIGRKLPGLLSTAGFSVRVDLLDRLVPPLPARFELLVDLPLESTERDAAAAAQAADARLAASGTPRVAHLPVFLATAVKG